jgi:hypothetical protein
MLLTWPKKATLLRPKAVCHIACKVHPYQLFSTGQIAEDDNITAHAARPDDVESVNDVDRTVIIFIATNLQLLVLDHVPGYVVALKKSRVNPKHQNVPL